MKSTILNAIFLRCSSFSSLLKYLHFDLFLVNSHHKPRIAKDQHPTCKTSDMLHSDIVTNGILHRKHDNFTFLGRVRNMKECLGLCCTFKKCELAYLVNNTKCFSTNCEDPAHCKIEKDKQKSSTKDIQMSLMVRNDENQKGILANVLMCLKVNL